MIKFREIKRRLLGFTRPLQIWVGPQFLWVWRYWWCDGGNINKPQPRPQRVRPHFQLFLLILNHAWQACNGLDLWYLINTTDGPPPFGIFYCHSVSRICLLILSINTLKLEENYKGELNNFFRVFNYEKGWNRYLIFLGYWIMMAGIWDALFFVLIKLMKQTLKFQNHPQLTLSVSESVLFYFSFSSCFHFSLFALAFLCPRGIPPQLCLCVCMCLYFCCPNIYLIYHNNFINFGLNWKLKTHWFWLSPESRTGSSFCWLDYMFCHFSPLHHGVKLTSLSKRKREELNYY